MNKRNSFNVGGAVLFLFLFSCMTAVSAEDTPTGVTFHVETHRHRHFNGADGHGDNWCQTWAKDGNIYTFADDGFGWIPRDQRDSPRFPDELAYSCRLWKIIEEDNSFVVRDVPNQPEYIFPTKWFGFGIISVDGTLYGTVTHVGGPGVRWNRPFNGFKLIYSPDLGNTWHLHDGRSLARGDHSGLS